MLAMSDSEEELNVREEEEEEEDGRRAEKVYLVKEKDEETYSWRRFIGARSFRLGLLISALVLVVLVVSIAATVVAVLATAPSSSSSSQSNKLFQLDDIFNSSFSYKLYSGEWTDDNKLLHSSQEDGVVLLDPSSSSSSSSSSTLISPEEWKELEEDLGTIENVWMSHDRNFAMIATNMEHVYRHSYVADYFLYNVMHKNLSNITLPSNSSGRIQLATWSPTDYIIAYVVDFDLYLYFVSNDSSVAMTTGGARNAMYSGIPDWAYEEEILSSNSALWWAPDGTHLLFAQFNDSNVEQFDFPLYGSYLQPQLHQYTTTKTIAYPKPGTANPTVKLMVCDLTSLLTPHRLTPPLLTDTDHYFVFAGWVNASVAMVTWMNRSSDSAVYCMYSMDMDNMDCEEVYTQTSRGWVELVEPPTVVSGGAAILSLVSKEEEEEDDSFLHILEMSYSASPQWRTTGAWEVTSIIRATDTDILYISTEKSPSQRHVYSAKTGSCLTCSQDSWSVPPSSNPSIPSRCDSFSASCSPSLQACLLHCLGPAIPYTLLVLYDGTSFKPVQYLQTNTELHDAVSDLSLPTVDMFQVPADDDGPVMDGRIMYPPGFNPKHTYPLLVYVYGGPNSQTVNNRTILSSSSLLFLCSNLTMIVASVDGRGTGYRGDNFKFSVYKHLGHNDTLDQIRAGRYLQKKRFVQSANIAIYGASYGGYMAGMVGSSLSGVYSSAISQSPVTDWYFYDSVYTERYMEQPQNNLNAYQVSSLLNRATNLSAVAYLLIHGTGDDNVHFQHSAQLVQSLTQAEVQFRLQFYTDKTHSLSGQPTKTHLYQLIRDFLLNSFQ